MKPSLFINILILFFIKRIKLMLKLVILMTSFQFGLNAQTLVTHDFDNGELVPYETRKADQRNRVKVINGAIETHWEQSKYNGTNSGRKAQFMPIGDPRFTQHIWMGLSLKIHSDYMKNNTNTNAGLMQIWGKNEATGAANHMCMLKFDGRNGGALVWQHRYNSVANKTHYLIQDNFPRDEFVDIVIHVQLKNRNEGTVEVWVNGELKLNKKNQTIGWGDMDETGMINKTYAFGTSLGQYNFMENASLDDAYDGKNHLFDGHMKGETRTVTYDNVSLYDQANGYNMVAPNGGEVTPILPTPPTPSVDGALVHITKRNATGFAIDGGNGGSNGQNVTLSSTNSSDEGQLWLEIDRGNGFYSYEKYGTNYSLDGNQSGAKNQSVYLWKTSATNQNQQWQKVAVGDGGFKLIKRNATGFAINGGSGGVEGRDINLWSSASTNQNLQWYITPINAVKDIRLEAEDFSNMSGIQTETSTESGDNVGWINNGDWIRFDDVNLSGITNMDARVSSRFTGGTIEVRLGSAKGTLIGSLDVSNTGGNQNWETLNTSISNTDGTHDVYIVFTGGNGYLYNLNWVEFNTTGRSSKDIDSLEEVIVKVSEVRLYPNPVVSTTIIENAANTTLNVYDMNGSVVFTQFISSEKETTDLSILPTGIYYGEITGESSISVVKIIKK